MIGILLEDTTFEQDIRELLMAFYPGRLFVYSEQDGVEFYVQGWQNDDHTQYYLNVIDLAQTQAAKDDDLLMEKDDANQGIEIVGRFETKNKIKRRLYQLLSKRSSRRLPWGTLTGIRPVKMITALMDEGLTEEAIAHHMKTIYLISDEKLNLLLKTALQEQQLLTGVPYKNGYSLYLGIPFCPTTCLYCSFTSYPIDKWRSKTKEYLTTLLTEMQYVAARMKRATPDHDALTSTSPDTIYIGGGTPTSLSAEELDWLLNKVSATFDLTAVREFTVEAGRPDSITKEKLLVLKKYGVTRISINPQTMKQQTLDLIGRHHTVDMVKECFRLARSLGFDNINMDLIIGLPNESIDDVRETMEQIKELNPDSLTIHSLAIKRAARLNTNKEHYADMEMINTQEIIDLTADYAMQMGMNPYYLYRQKNMAGNFENVGYAKDQKACLYNIFIMEEKQSILACGAGTSTKVVYPSENRLERAENVKDILTYLDRIDEMIQRKEKLLAKL